MAAAVRWDWISYAAEISHRRSPQERHMRHDDQQNNNPIAVSPERSATINEIINRVTQWAAHNQDVAGLLLVGSCARQAARPDSDIDIVLLTTDEYRYTDTAWAAELALGTLIRTCRWGPITEQRFATSAGLEVEINIGSPEWANTHPTDPGTHRVVTDGAKPLYDPTGILANLLRTCRA
ncbi:nucleotidyltransferase domain-containing protein [Nocardia suismassiliense]|uniref:Nucleotidyltransferase domain-containing protein n=1 Tax=Nocardia suismassiliense TaxID=2077092 RepID=A0ABW6R7Z2_9NOCA